MCQPVRTFLALLAVALTTQTFAQPYPASGGFDRATRVATADGLPSATVASDGGEVYLYWDDGEGIMRRPLTGDHQAEAELVVAARTVRRVLAVTVQDAVALVRIQRDPATGSWQHYLSWRGEERLLLHDLRQSPVAVAPGPEGPAVLLGRFVGSSVALELHRWDGTIEVLRESEKEIDGLSLRFDGQGAIHLSWLEGEVLRTELGNISEWEAYYTLVATDGTVSTPLNLGSAGRRGVQFVTRVDLTPAGATVMWTTEAGELKLTRPGEEPQSLGGGHPIGVFGDLVYWFDADSIRRRRLTGGQVENVVWSPNTPELVSSLELDGTLFLAWYGSKVGGGYAVFSADNQRPIDLTLLDRVAGRMGWSPWTFWESLGGQSLTSLLVALLATLVLSPVMLVASLLVARFVNPERGTSAGIAIGVATLLVAVALVVLRSLSTTMTSPWALVGSPWELALASALGAGFSWLVRRKADSEVIFELVASAGLSSLVTLALLGFANFQTWSELWEGVL